MNGEAVVRRGVVEVADGALVGRQPPWGEPDGDGGAASLRRGRVADGLITGGNQRAYGVFWAWPKRGCDDEGGAKRNSATKVGRKMERNGQTDVRQNQIFFR